MPCPSIYQLFFSLLSVIMFSSVKFEKQKQSCLIFTRNYSLNLLYFWYFFLFHLFCGAVIVLAYYLLFNILFIVLFSIRKYLNTNTRNELECFSLFIFFQKNILIINYFYSSFISYLQHVSFSIFSFKKINKFFNYFGHVFLWIFAICWLILNMGKGSSGIGGFEQNHQILFTQNVMIY